MDTKSTIYLLYELFSRGMGDSSYSWKPNDKSEILVNNFIQRWEKRGVVRESLGINFLYNYFCDSYNFWTNSGENLRVIPLSWVIGEPQLKRWDKRIEEYVYSYTEGLLSHANIPTLTEIKKSIVVVEVKQEIDLSQEVERRRFFNTPEGFINCLLVTTLCDPRSKWCKDCTYSKDCIEELVIRDKRLALRRKFIKL